MKSNEKFHLKRKIELVKNGQSKVFENWKEYGLITEDEFIEALNWLCSDPLTGDGNLTREIALMVTKDMENKILSERTDGSEKFADDYDQNNLKGEIVKLERKYSKYETIDGWKEKFAGFYRIDNNRLWNGNGIKKIALSPTDRV